MSGAKRPASPSSPDQFINFTIKYNKDGDVVNFRVRKTVPLMKVFRAFCARKMLAYRTIQFIYSGEAVREKNTPEQLRMKDGDELDAMEHQSGGGSEMVTMGW